MAAHKKYRGNASKASSNLGYTVGTVTQYWNDAGLKAEGKANKVHERKVKSIIAAHRRFKGNAREAARHLPFSDTTIKNYWRSAGLNPLAVRNQYQ